MKKILVIAVIAFAVTAQAFADWGGPGQGPSSHSLPEAEDSGSDLVSVTISGTFAVAKGLSRLMRSVPDLVVGAKVIIQGYLSVIMDDGSAAGHYFKARAKLMPLHIDENRNRRRSGGKSWKAPGSKNRWGVRRFRVVA